MMDAPRPTSEPGVALDEMFAAAAANQNDDADYAYIEGRA